MKPDKDEHNQTDDFTCCLLSHLTTRHHYLPNPNVLLLFIAPNIPSDSQGIAARPWKHCRYTGAPVTFALVNGLAPWVAPQKAIKWEEEQMDVEMISSIHVASGHRQSREITFAYTLLLMYKKWGGREFFWLDTKWIWIIRPTGSVRNLPLLCLIQPIHSLSFNFHYWLPIFLYRLPFHTRLTRTSLYCRWEETELVPSSVLEGDDVGHGTRAWVWELWVCRSGLQSITKFSTFVFCSPLKSKL